MLNRREFGLLLGLGIANTVSLPAWTQNNSTSLPVDFLTSNYLKFQSQHGVSESGFSFEAKKLVLPKKTLPINEDRFCLMNFKLHSKQRRFSIVNKNSKTELSALASHGINTGNSMAFDFSNTVDSFKSSLGIYVTGAHYIGHFGPSIVLHGISASNNNVAIRNIVLHGANYCSPEHIAKHGFLGRSLGCIALPKDKMISAFQILRPGTLLFTETPGPIQINEALRPATKEEIVENKIT